MAKYFTSFILFLTFLSGFASPVFNLKYADSEIDLAGKISSFKDNSRKLKINEVSLSKEFVDEHKSTFAFGYTKANCWTKTEFVYKSDISKPFCFTFQIPLTYNVDFYLFENGMLVKQMNTGIVYPFGFNRDDNRYYVFNFDPIPHQKYTFFCMAHNDQGAVNFPIKLKSTEDFNAWYELESYSLFGFFSLLGIAFLVSMAMFINFRDKAYLYYAGYLISIFLLRFSQFGFAFKYLHPQSPEIAIISKVLYWIIACIFFINFVPLLLSSTKMYFPRATTIFKIQSLFYILLLGFIPFYSFSENPSETVGTWSVLFMQLNFMISMILVLTITYKSFRKGYGPARLFAFAFIPLVIICILATLSNLGIVPNSFITNYPIEIGVTIEILFLSAALVSRYKIIFNERYSLAYKLAEIEKQMAERLLLEKDNSIEKYQHSKFSKDELTFNYEELLNYIHTHKPYLDEGMNMTKLAELTGIHSHLISQIINQIENKNFFDFMNYFRIAYAKDLLLSHKYENYSVEGIGYECGFNTKATFYNTFKKGTGLTPAEYRKKQLQH